MAKAYSQSAYILRPGTPPTSTVHRGIYGAACIATRYASRVPTVDELCAEYEMSRATAYRWIAAFKHARGLAA
jgi:hypothetical protein